MELLGDVEGTHCLAHGRELVVLVIDQELRRQTSGFRLAPKQTHAQAVEGRDPGPHRVIAQQPRGAHPHLLGRLVGEGDGQDSLRRHAAVEREVRDPVGNDPRLPAAGAGQDQDRPGDGLYGLALARVEAGQDF
jgi:hypothetical protein